MQLSHEVTSVQTPAARVPKWAGAMLAPGRLSMALVRSVLSYGGVSSPRGYRREGFPEHELYLVMSGRKDHFDSL